MDIYFKLPSKTGLKKFLIYLLFFGNLAGIVALWSIKSGYYISNPGYGNIYIALGRLTGLVAELSLLTQLVLIGRVRWFEHLYGFDRLNKVHRWIGYSILLLILGHPTLLVIGNAQANGVGLWQQFLDFLANKEHVLLAFISVTIFIYIVILSIVIVRKKLRYEMWYFTHLLTYVAIGMTLFHQLGTGDLRSGGTLYYWYILNFSVFGSILFYRFLRPFARFAYHNFTVDRLVQESPDTCSLYIKGNRLDRFRFQAGQYANITILAKGMWYTHPFSLSSAYNGEYIRFTIKNSGDFTSKIPLVKPGTHVIIDGPLGLFVEERAERDKFLFIAGGIGITPLRSMLESLVAKGKDVALLYAVKTEKDLVFRKEIETFQGANPAIKTHYVLGAPLPGYETGFVDQEKIVRLVPDFYSREVFLCGPPPMMAAVVKSLTSIGFSEDHVHYEKFSF